MHAIGKKTKCWLMNLGRVLLIATFALATPAAYSASKTVLVLGDSLSAEYGLRRGSGWVALLEQQLQKDRIPATIINASISGETTSGGRGRLPALLKRHKPDVVVIELGANDGLRGLPLEAAEDNLRNMVKDSQQAGARVLLIGMQLPPNYGSDYTKRFSGMYGALAKELNAALVPFLFAKMSDQPDMFQGDRIHPAESAQPLMLQTVYPQLKPLLTR